MYSGRNEPACGLCALPLQGYKAGRFKGAADTADRGVHQNLRENRLHLIDCQAAIFRRKIWGTRFCGLEVKPPAALKGLPDTCGILICNIYYREIEKQLEDMGIHNIEFFNDEYMPAFHFDRLEG